MTDTIEKILETKRGLISSTGWRATPDSRAAEPGVGQVGWDGGNGRVGRDVVGGPEGTTGRVGLGRGWRQCQSARGDDGPCLNVGVEKIPWSEYHVFGCNSNPGDGAIGGTHGLPR